MKKILLTSFAVLSVIGVQAQTTFTQGNVTYEAEQNGNPIVQNEGRDTVSTYETTTLSSTGLFLCQQEIQHEITTLYKYNATAKKIGEVPSVSLYNFNIYTGANNLDGSRIVTGNLGSYTVYEVGSTEYIEEFSHLKNLESSSIYSYDQMSNDTDPIAEYSYFVKNSKGNWVETPATGITDDNLKRTGYFYKYTYETNKYYCQVQNIGIAKKTTTLNHRNDSCTVIAIKKNAALANEYITSISLGKDISSIGDMAFMNAENLSNFSVQNGGHYVYQNGILYNSEKTDIEAAGCNVQSQVIPSSVSTIKKYAFWNTVDEITITSMNSSLDKNEGYQGSKVTFITPSANLTVTAADNGGYNVTGNVTRSNFSGITQTGTYFDFTGANIMEDLAIDNETNTIYYFTTTANVTGNNVVNNGTCANFVLKDSYRTSKFYCPTSFTAIHASYDRVFDNCWSSMCIPFSADGSVVNGKFYCGEFRTYKEASALFSFLYSTSITANTPYIIRTVEDNQELTISAENTTVHKTENVEVVKGNASFFNNYEPTTIYSNADYNYFGIKKSTGASGNPSSNMVKLTGATVNSFRSYLRAPFEETNYEAAKIRLVDAMDNEIEVIELPYTTGIEKIENAENVEAIFDLNGQMLKEAKRGLNIVNGVVVINK